jgi:hypothetical protein
MKRRRAGHTAVLAAVLGLLAAGCGNPSGTDGDLLDDWAALGRPGVPVPVVGSCWSSTATAFKLAPDNGMKLVDCSAEHASETFYVGQFTGTPAQGSAVPAEGDLGGAYTTCDDQAKNFLADDWHNGRLVLRVFPPTDRQWAGEARFYRCDLVEAGNDNGAVVQRTASLKATLDGSRPVGLTCVQVKISGDAIDDFVPIGCATTHNGEYVGTFFSPDARPYPTDAGARRSLLEPGCAALVAKFLGLTEAEYNTNKQISFAWSTASPTSWAYGDRSARCYIVLEGTLSVSRSLKGNGNKPV